MRSLNGWQRIGIILSVLWCLSIVGLTVYEYFEVFQDEQLIKKCQQIKDGVIQLDKNDLFYTLFCNEPPNPRPRPNILLTFAVLALPIVGAWLFVYVSVWTSKWVVAGFSSKKKNL